MAQWPPPLYASVSSASQLLVCMRYCWSCEMIKKFLFGHQMSGRATGLDVFNALCDF